MTTTSIPILQEQHYQFDMSFKRNLSVAGSCNGTTRSATPDSDDTNQSFEEYTPTGRTPFYKSQKDSRRDPPGLSDSYSASNDYCQYDDRDQYYDGKRSKQCNNRVQKRRTVDQYKMKIKTELCKNWETLGWCKFGDKCSFAHGKTELQEKTHVDRTFYKLRPCLQFHQHGYCYYGQRCQFLHKEAMIPNIFHKTKSHPSWGDRIVCDSNLVMEIWRMISSEIKVQRILDKIPKKNRLPIFKEICSQNE